MKIVIQVMMKLKLKKVNKIPPPHISVKG